MNTRQDTGARRHDIARPGHEYLLGLIFAGIALLGPLCGFVFDGALADGTNLANTWYSLPMALFAIPALIIPIRNPTDYIGGAALAALGLFALWAANDLSGMRGYSFGTGTAPRLFAYALIICGMIVALTGFFKEAGPSEKFAFSGPFGGAVLILALIPITYYLKNPDTLRLGISPGVVGGGLSALALLALAFMLARIAPRGPIFITASVLIFAITIRPLGLVIASFLSIMVSAHASDETRWIETVIWAAVLTIFCALLFPYALSLPLPLWPQI